MSDLQRGAPDWDAGKLVWPNATLSRFVRLGGAVTGRVWHVQRAGPAGGPAALLVHGTAGATHAWWRMLPRLAEWYDVVACDLPGHGFTDAPPAGRLTLAGMAADVAELCRALGVRPTLAVGHSAGLPILWRMALDGTLPDARLLVGFNAALGEPPDAWRTLAGGDGAADDDRPTLLGRVFGSDVAASFATWYAARAGVTESFLRSTGGPDALPAEIVACYRLLTASARHMRSALTMMAQWDVAPTISQAAVELTVPTRLIVGTEDRWVPPRVAEHVAARVREVTVERWAGQGHLMHEAAGDEAADRVLRAAAQAGLPGAAAAA